MNTPTRIAACTHQGHITMYLCHTLQCLDAIQFALGALHNTTPQYMKIQGRGNLKLYLSSVHC